ncbi:MAG: thioredoxin family protein [Solirubrobacterales bacterium]
MPGRSRQSKCQRTFQSKCQRTSRIAVSVAIAAALAVATTGCGDETTADADPIAQIKAAAKVNPADFPQTDGAKNFAAIRSEAKAGDGTSLLPAANDIVAGRVNRFPFGLFSIDRKPIWGPTVIYIAESSKSPAQGPFAVAAHALDVPKEFRSVTSASDYDTIGSGFYTAIFNAGKDVRKMNLMSLTKTSDGFESASSGVVLRSDDPAPAPGEKAPAIKTDTLEDGTVADIDTRKPPSGMHDISLDDALKQKKPVVLLFATPLLCASRICGPVIDVAAQVRAKVGDKAIFVHQEIFKDNDPDAGYRPQIAKYGLTSEPFTFVIDKNGRVSSQLQGPFVAAELEAALKLAGV